MQKQLEMLKKMIDFIVLKENIDVLSAFEKLIDFMAIKVHVDTSVVFSSKKDIFKDLDEMFDLSLLLENRKDWLTELLTILKLNDININKKDMIELDINQNDFPTILLDTNITDLDFIIKLHNKYNNSILFYGICKDLLLYHMALINFKLYGINSIILYNPSKTINPETYKTDNRNWLYANRWNAINVVLLQ